MNRDYKKLKKHNFMYAMLALVLTILPIRAQKISNQNFYGIEVSKKIGVLSNYSHINDKETAIKTKNLAYHNLKLKRMGVTSSTHSMTSGFQFNEHPYTGYNVPMASITDNSGNTYIVGTSSNDNSPQGDFVTIKIDSNGNQVWEKREPGTIYAGESALKIDLDTAQNPIVTGTVWNGSNIDIKTVKYNAITGTIMWSNTYAGDGDGIDVPTAIKVDSNDNTVVSGITYTGSNVAYVTLKYSNNGNLTWSITDSGLVNDAWYEPSAVVVDNNDDIIVTGYGVNTSYFTGYYTIKYSASGQLLWKKLHVHQDANNNDTNSFARAIAVDNNNNYFITGSFNSTNESIGTIKYDQNGNLIWIDTFKNGTNRTNAYDIKITSNSNTIYVAGTHFGDFTNEGMVLLSYQQNNTLNWSEITNNLHQPQKSFLKLTPQNQPVIATLGKDPTTENKRVKILKYDNAQNLLEQASYFKAITTNVFTQVNNFIGFDIHNNNNYISLDNRYTNQGNVFEYSKHNMSSGDDNPDWTNQYANTANSNTEMLYAFKDNNDNTYVTGTYGSVNANQYITNHLLTKYNQTGNIEWEKVYNPANGNSSNGIYATHDTSNNIIVYLIPDPYNGDPLRIKKYDPNGNLLWEVNKTLDTPQIYTLFTDEFDNIYLAGNAFQNTADTFPKFTTIKFDTNGTQKWIAFEGSVNANDNIFQINDATVSSSGEIVLVGAVGSSSFFSQDLDQVMLKYTSNGNLLSNTTFPITNNSTIATNVIIDNNNIYMAGYKQDQSTYVEELILTSINTTGTTNWSSSYGETNRNVRPYEMKKLLNGDLVLSGYSNSLNDNKIIAVAFSQSGNKEWDKATELNRYYTSMYTDANDTVYILCQELGSTFPYRLPAMYTRPTLFKIDPNLTVQEEVFDGPERALFFPKALVPLSNNSLLLAGTLSYEREYYSGFYFLESNHQPLKVDEQDFPNGNQNQLGQNLNFPE